FQSPAALHTRSLHDALPILVSARLTRLHRGLVLVLAEVHELDDRRPSGRGDLDQVEIRLLGKPGGVLDPDDADLFSVGADEPDLWNSDPVIDAGLRADVVLLLVGMLIRNETTRMWPSKQCERRPCPCLRRGLQVPGAGAGPHPKGVARTWNPTTCFGRAGWEDLRLRPDGCNRSLRRRIPDGQNR